MPREAHVQPFDPLSQVFESLGLRAELFARVEASGHWGIDIPGGDHYFHAVLSGKARVTSGDQKPFELAQGDLIFLFDGKRHTIVGERGDKARPLDLLIQESWVPERGLMKLGIDPTETVVICGTFITAQFGYGDMLSPLPNPLILRRGDFESFDPVGVALTLLGLESKNHSPGSAIVCARLVEMLLVYGVRQWLHETEGKSTNWLRGLMDPFVGKALNLIHSDLGAKWEVDVLAARVGLSRSAFAGRFTSIVGESPLKYITRWRMNVARTMLVLGGRVGEVAAHLGYESDSAFSRAFKRYIGEAPTFFKPR